MDSAQRKKYRTSSYFVLPIGALLFVTDALNVIDTSFWPSSLPSVQAFGALLIGLGLIHLVRSLKSSLFVVVLSMLFSLAPLSAMLLFDIAPVDGYASVAGVLTGYALGAAIIELWRFRKAAMLRLDRQ